MQLQWINIYEFNSSIFPTFFPCSKQGLNINWNFRPLKFLFYRFTCLIFMVVGRNTRCLSLVCFPFFLDHATGSLQCLFDMSLWDYTSWVIESFSRILFFYCICSNFCSDTLPAEDILSMWSFLLLLGDTVTYIFMWQTNLGNNHVCFNWLSKFRFYFYSGRSHTEYIFCISGLS
jgi:hypothetical protein